MMEEIINLSKQYPNDGEFGKELRRYLNGITIEESYKDRYVRLFAEFDNYKKRTIKEKEDIKNATKTNILSSILDLDNDLSIALKHIKDPGIQLMISKLDKFLISQGIETIQTVTYDTDLHEVISILGEGTDIIDVASKGYMIGGKPFRYPKIILGKRS